MRNKILVSVALLVLVVVSAFTLFGGRKELVGTWLIDGTSNGTYEFTNDGKITVNVLNNKMNGTYEDRKDHLVITSEDGSVDEVDYEMPTKNTLNLIMGDVRITFKRIK